jgi:2-phosphosulfolactate phosphatase
VAELVGRPFVGGIASVAHEAAPARSLISAGFEADVQACLTLDHFERAVRYRDRQLQLDAMIAPR